ncbi:MAG: hypothetical protein Q4G18_07240 [Myroides sp.]|nr:hypothetical protein [Myroides sp.]
MKIYVVLFCLTSLFGYSQTNTAAQHTIPQKQVGVLENHELLTQFVLYGMVDQSNNDKAIVFKEKYDVSFKFNGCVILPTDLKQAETNNKKVATILDEKYGVIWQSELPFSVPGVQKIDDKI